MSCEINFTPAGRRFLKGLRVKPADFCCENLSNPDCSFWKGRRVK